MTKTKKSTLALALVAGLALSGAAQAALHDRGGGLIYDDVLDITWLQNTIQGAGSVYDSGYEAGVSTGYMTWANAMAWAENLSYHDSVRGVTYDDWRLPSALNPGGSISCGTACYNTELGYMFFTNFGATAFQSVLAGTNTANLQLFTNLLNDTYWTGQSFPGSYAWSFRMDIGRQFPIPDGANNFAWAVRDGDVAAVPEAGTWAMLLTGLAVLAGSVRRRRR